METVQSAFGYLVLAGLAWALGENRRWVRPRVVIARLGMKAIVAGTLATCMTGAVIGML